MKNFLTTSNNIQRDSYIWNMTGCMLQALQSVILLMIITRIFGLAQAGVFTFAYANANLFLNVGKYGMRYYQATDIQEQYSFGEYVYSRIITTFAMLVIAGIYTGYAATSNNYSMEKSGIIVWMCIYKAADSIEDVFEGNYQQKGRLDIASKIFTLRIGFTIFIYAISLLLLRNQLFALISATMATFISMALLLYYASTASTLQQSRNIQFKHIGYLLWTCFPLCIGCFLAFYIGSAPKYAIDAHLSDSLQACYGFIAMPIFVFEILNTFIFSPFLHQMAIYWEKSDMPSFVRYIIIQIAIILSVMVVCVIGAWIVGIPVLSWMYHTDLSAYKKEFLILLMGGGFLGLSGYLNALITVIRFQRNLVWGYVIVAILAFLLSAPVVCKYELMGAAMLYMMLMGGLSFCFVGVLIWGLKKGNMEENRW